MVVKMLGIEGVFEITPPLYIDKRGSFEKKFNVSHCKEYGMITNISEYFVSSSNKGVIRGMHFQTPPFDCAKYISVIEGSAMDVILDLRKNSPTYGGHISIILNPEERNIIYIPPGCAHGFLSLEDGTKMTYLQTKEFSLENDCGVRFDSFGMNWPIHSMPILSDKDLNLPLFSNFVSPF